MPGYPRSKKKLLDHIIALRSEWPFFIAIIIIIIIIIITIIIIIIVRMTLDTDTQ